MAEIEGLDKRQLVDGDEYTGENRTRLCYLTGFSWDFQPWEFDYQRFWFDPLDGAVYTASDSGCSCPIPFENTTIGDLAPIKRMQDLYDLFGDSSQYDTDVIDSFNQARKDIEEHLAESKNWSARFLCEICDEVRDEVNESTTDRVCTYCVENIKASYEMGLEHD